MAKKLNRLVPAFGALSLATAALCGCEGEEQYPPMWFPISEWQVITVVDDVVLYRDFSGLTDGNGNFDLNRIDSAPLFAKRVGYDSPAIRIFEDLPDAKCGTWASNELWVLPVPEILGETDGNSLRLCLVSIFGCIRVVEINFDEARSETLAEVPGNGVPVHSIEPLNETTFVIGAATAEVDRFELRRFEFVPAGLGEAPSVPIPKGRFFLFELSDGKYLGPSGFDFGEGFVLSRSDNRGWEVAIVSFDETDPCYRGDMGRMPVPRGSSPILRVGLDGDRFRINCEERPEPDEDQGEAIGGWVRRDNGASYLLLDTGRVVEWQRADRDGRWIETFEIPGEFHDLVDASEGYPRMGRTHAEGEFWFSRGKDRIALMRVDLDGDAAPEWEWLVNE